ncbi:cytidine deaminase [uncultured Endozoicomonas sp.]|uniref:cytidine deaminase n=1 Tax=uncultured Endozoicomonas sp. TaxID=432652 RepID=UPI00260A9E8F|nr:cytidine deaminase [uncultured Endozoicomonas sp.]
MNHQMFLDQLATFPANTTELLRQIMSQSGRLDPEQVDQLKALMSLEIDDLMKALLPLAAAMSTCPISHFSVGAIVEGYRENAQGPLYLGANLEIAGHPLKNTIHAEQSAICNAWHQGETRLRRLMVNEAPCGHCRQFMNELNDIDNMDIVISQLGSEQKHHYKMANLLPNAFGPADLKQETRLLDLSTNQLQSPDASDELVNAATLAAQNSYAPYSGCASGVALRLDSGAIITGRYAENAAFNPGMIAIESALVNLRLEQLTNPKSKVVDAVLVEMGDSISHQSMTEAMARNLRTELRVFTI